MSEDISFKVFTRNELLCAILNCTEEELNDFEHRISYFSDEFTLNGKPNIKLFNDEERYSGLSQLIANNIREIVKKKELELFRDINENSEETEENIQERKMLTNLLENDSNDEKEQDTNENVEDDSKESTPFITYTTLLLTLYDLVLNQLPKIYNLDQNQCDIICNLVLDNNNQYILEIRNADILSSFLELYQIEEISDFLNMKFKDE